MKPSDLAKRKCTHLTREQLPLESKEIIPLLMELGAAWSVVNDHHLEKQYTFNSFKEALDFTNRVAQVADSENHHPDIHLSYGKVRLIIWSQVVGGLSQNDFILAAKCDQLVGSA